MEPYKITRPGEPFAGPHIGPQLAKKLNTHRWHVLRIEFVDEPQPETYEAVVAAKTVTPNAIKKLLAKAWCARQIMWPNRQIGILLETECEFRASSAAYLAHRAFSPARRARKFCLQLQTATSTENPASNVLELS